VGLVTASQATTLAQFQILFGVLVGLAAGSFYTPLTATTTRWFTQHRSLAVALVSAGIGLGSSTVAPLARWIITNYDWRLAMLVIGNLAWLVIIPAALLVREPAGSGSAVGPIGGAAGGERELTVTQAIRTPQFAAIALTYFACCAAHSGPIFHMVAHAMDLGVAKLAAAGMLGLSGASSIVGRVGSGILADRFGAKRALVGMLTLQAATVSAYLAADGVLSLFAVALVFGVGYGGAMPLYALVARERFGDHAIGTAFGGIFFISAIGMGLGSWAGGYLFDHLGSYWSLYLGSTLVGVAAVAVALALPAPRLTPVLAAAR
jgi:predicted MFS family arabinose efflux permease